MTKLNYKSYELAALSSLLLRPFLPPPATLFRLTPLVPYSVSLPFSLHFYYDEPSSPLFRASSALCLLLVTRSSLPLPPRPLWFALLFLLQTFPLRRRDTALICKERTVDNIREKWRASRWGQRTRARWPDRS